MHFEYQPKKIKFHLGKLVKAMHRMVILFNRRRDIKATKPGILDTQEIKSDFTSIMPYCSMDYISY